MRLLAVYLQLALRWSSAAILVETRVGLGCLLFLYGMVWASEFLTLLVEVVVTVIEFGTLNRLPVISCRQARVI